MPQNRERSPRWVDCKRVLRDAPSDGLIRLVRDLYSFSDENRAFLHARLLPEQSEDALKHAMDKLRKMLSYSSVVNNRFRHRDVKRLVEQFAKASTDDEAVAKLLLVDLEESLQTFDQLGDVPELADHSMSMMDRLDKLLRKVPRAKRQPLVERLMALAHTYERSFGYGLSDELADLANDWNERMGKGPLEAV